MELEEPSIKTAFKKCVENGAMKIVCHPYFLSNGKHVQEDIPSLLRIAAADYPDVSFTITEPLGMEEMIVQLIKTSIEKVFNEK
jgi:sirohydrochlorin ferrochelatase